MALGRRREQWLLPALLSRPNRLRLQRPCRCSSRITLALTRLSPSIQDRTLPGAVVRVSVSCTVEYADLLVPGFPGATRIQATQEAVVDAIPHNPAVILRPQPNMDPIFGHRLEGHPDQGSLTVFVAVLVLALSCSLASSSMVAERWLPRVQRRARLNRQLGLGATQISVQAIRSGIIAVDPTAAARIAASYLRAVGTAGSVTVAGDTVNVHIESSEPTVVLGIVGVQKIGVSATASATNVHGVTREDR